MVEIKILLIINMKKLKAKLQFTSKVSSSNSLGVVALVPNS